MGQQLLFLKDFDLLLLHNHTAVVLLLIREIREFEFAGH